MGVRAGILVVGLGVLLGCGGSRSSESGNLRFLQGSPDAPQVNLLVDGKSVATNIGYINATGYVSVKSGSRHVQVVPVSGASPVLDANITITASGNQTLIISGPAAGIQNVLLTDGGTTATTGDAHVRVVNASSSMGTADVYIVPSHQYRWDTAYGGKFGIQFRYWLSVGPGRGLRSVHDCPPNQECLPEYRAYQSASQRQPDSGRT